MEEFVIPIHPEDLLNGTSDQFFVQNELIVENLSDAELESLLEEISNRLKRKENIVTDSQNTTQENSGVWTICDHENFDPLFSIVKNAPSLSAECKSQTLSILQSCLDSATHQIGEFLREEIPDDNDFFTKSTSLRRNALKAYVFLLEWLISTEEMTFRKMQSENPLTARETGKRGKKKQQKRESVDENTPKLSIWELESEKEKILRTFANVLELDLPRLWLLPQPEEAFVNLFSKLAFQLLENPANIKSKTVKKCAFTLVASTVKKYSHALHVISSMVHLLYKFEHFVTPLVEMLEFIVVEFEYPQIVGDILREISKVNPREIARDVTGTKNVSVFLGELAERLPKNVLPFVSLLLIHLENESYIMRNGVIQVITFLIHKAFQPQDSDEMNNMSSAAINTRDSLLHVLLERFYDVNAFARSKVVQSWSYLCQHRAIPLKLFSAVTERAVGRLEDKAAHVRKNAIQLLTFLLQFNPYSAQLSYSSFEQNLKRVDNLISDKMGKTAEELLEQRDETTELDPEDDKHLKAYCYYRDALQFISEIHKAIPIICELLGSKNSSDVLEAIQFFVTVQRFNMERAKEGLRKMLMLAWSKESNIRDALLKAYVELYLTPPDMDFPNKRLGHLYIAKNLIGLTIGATPGELTSLEELLTNLMQAKHIPGQVINLLWDIFAQKSEESSAAEGRGALIILSMLANADPTIVSSKLSLLVNVGLGPRAYHDPVLAKWVCIALQKLSNSSLTKQKWDNVNNENAKENSPEENDEQYKPGNRFRANHPLFEKLAQLVKDEAAAIPIMKWFSATEQALNTIYSISENPDQLAAKIVRDMAKTALTCLERQINQNSDGVAKQDNSTETLETKNMNPNNNFQNDSAILGLARLFFVVGHVALKQLVYIEEIYKELERRCEKKRGEKKPSPNSHQPSINETRSRKSILMDYRKFKKQRQSQFDIDAKDTGLEVKSGEEQELIEKELGHVGNTIDAEIEAARVSVEKGIVHQNLLGQFGPLLVKVCANAEGHFCHPLLRASAVLALLKFMTVSAEFCEQNLQLLFTILLKDDKDGHNSLLRANIVIALGDLAFRFPNLVEPWTHHIYSRLRDPDARVRKNTLMVLTHLILNDMIKIKGQISEMALCLEDKEPRIADLARLFFHELSCKGNTIYNVLPDAISGLSAAIKETSSDSFKNIMKYLFSFIEKDKQVDSLVEKLCHRFSMSNESKQWRDIAYCLTLLNYTEKSFKKLSDLFKFYKDAIADETVYESLLAIATKARKFAKQELKVVIDEFEAKVTNCFNVHKENNNVIAKAKQNETKGDKKMKSKKQQMERKSRTIIDDDEEEDNEPTSDIELFSVENESVKGDEKLNDEESNKKQAEKTNEPIGEEIEVPTGASNRETNEKTKNNVREDKMQKRSRECRRGKQTCRQREHEESSDKNENEYKSMDNENQDNQPSKNKPTKRTRKRSSKKVSLIDEKNERDVKMETEEHNESTVSSHTTITRSRPVRKATIRSRQRIITSDDEDDVQSE